MKMAHLEEEKWGKWAAVNRFHFLPVGWLHVKDFSLLFFFFLTVFA